MEQKIQSLEASNQQIEHDRESVISELRKEKQKNTQKVGQLEL